MIWAGTVLAVLAIALLRMSWSGSRRSTALNGAAWGLLLAGVMLGASAYGAWGVTIVVIAACLMALILLVPDALGHDGEPKRTPRRRSSPPRNRMRLGGRVLTFVLAIPLAMIAALSLSVGAHALASVARWHPADGVVLALMLFPVLWAVLTTAVLMMRRA